MVLYFMVVDLIYLFLFLSAYGNAESVAAAIDTPFLEKKVSAQHLVSSHVYLEYECFFLHNPYESLGCYLYVKLLYGFCSCFMFSVS